MTLLKQSYTVRYSLIPKLITIAEFTIPLAMIHLAVNLDIELPPILQYDSKA